MTLQVLHFPLTADNVPRSLCLSFPLISSLSISFSFSLGLSVVRTHINFFFLLRLYIFFFFSHFVLLVSHQKFVAGFVLDFCFYLLLFLALLREATLLPFWSVFVYGYRFVAAAPVWASIMALFIDRASCLPFNPIFIVSTLLSNSRKHSFTHSPSISFFCWRRLLSSAIRINESGQQGHSLLATWALWSCFVGRTKVKILWYTEPRVWLACLFFYPCSFSLLFYCCLFLLLFVWEILQSCCNFVGKLRKMST